MFTNTAKKECNLLVLFKQSKLNFTCSQINTELDLTSHQFNAKEIPMSSHRVQNKRGCLAGFEFEVNVISIPYKFSP